MNRQQIIESIGAERQAAAPKVDYSIGDTLNIHVRIVEGEKERIQVFQGVLIAIKGRGINKVITVRRIVANEGVERTFPVCSPLVSKVEVVRRSDSRRAKLYYLRNRVGKSRRLRDQRRGLKHIQPDGEVEGAEAAAAHA